MCGEIRLRDHVTPLRTTDGTPAETGHGFFNVFFSREMMKHNKYNFYKQWPGLSDFFLPLRLHMLCPLLLLLLFKVTEPSILETKRITIATVVLQRYLNTRLRWAHSNPFSSRTRLVFWRLYAPQCKNWLQIECHLSQSHWCPEVVE